MRLSRPATRTAAALSAAVLLTGGLAGCNREAVAPEQGVDAGEPTVPADDPDTSEPGTGEGADVGVDGTTGVEPGEPAGE